MSHPVKWMHSNMQGAPQITNANGDLTTTLDAVLVTGFNLRTVTSITRQDNTATLTIASGHLYEVGQIVRISGCDQPAYNGDKRVLTRTANTLTLEVTGDPVSPATGANIQIRTPGLGFEIAFSGTQKRAYRSPNVESTRPILRVDDSLDPAYNASYAKKGKVTLCEGMSDIDTFVGKQAPYNSDFPTRNHLATGSGTTVIDGWHKWYYALRTDSYTYVTEAMGAPGGSKSWVVVGDDRGFYFFVEWHAGQGRVMYAFTDFKSYRAGDAYNTILVATDAYMTANNQFAYVQGSTADWNTYSTRTHNSTGKLALAAHTQVGVPAGLFFTSLATNPSGASVATGYATGVPWPNGPDYGLLFHPVYLQEASGNHLRGQMPGMLWIHNNWPAVSHLEILDGVGGYAGRKFLIVAAHYYESTTSMNRCRVAFDITGPWW